MKKILIIILILILNISIISNSFAWYSESQIQKSESEIAKEIWIDLQTLKDVGFSFEMYNDWRIDKLWVVELKKSIKNNLKLYNSIIKWDEILIDFEKKYIPAPFVPYPINSQLLKNNDWKIVWVWYYTRFSQDWLPALYWYHIVTLYKDWTHLVEDSITLINLGDIKWFLINLF